MEIHLSSVFLHLGLIVLVFISVLLVVNYFSKPSDTFMDIRRPVLYISVAIVTIIELLINGVFIIKW